MLLRRLLVAFVVLVAASAPISADTCARAADILVIATAWPQFRTLGIEALRRPTGKLPVLDCWRMLPVERFGQAVDLIYLGRNDRVEAARNVVAAAGAA